jgi:hypothetical protein
MKFFFRREAGYAHLNQGGNVMFPMTVAGAESAAPSLAMH